MTIAPSDELQTTVVLTLTRSNRAAIKWLKGYFADETLSKFPLKVLYGERGIPMAAHLAENAAHTELIPLPEDATADRSLTAAQYAKTFQSIETPYVVHTFVTRHAAQGLEALRNQIASGHERIAELEIATPHPVLLYTRQYKNSPMRAYIASVLESAEQPSGAFADYLGYLALMSGTLTLESIDAVDDEAAVFVQARCALGRANSLEAPPWTFRLVVSDRRQPPFTEATAPPSPRVNSQGTYRWENVAATVPMANVPDGNHLVMIGLVSKYPGLQTLRALRPRPGALADSRTQVLRNAHSADQIRYLIHTIRSAPQTWVTVQHGAGPAAERRWNRVMLRKDLRHIFRSARRGRLRAARLIHILAAPAFRQQDVWLVGERADTAQDNGYHFFRHMRTHHPHRRVYYVMDKKSPQYSRVQALGNIVQHSSLRHKILMTQATVLANAYSIRHMIPHSWDRTAYVQHLAWRVGAQRVYLKHGVNTQTNNVKRSAGGYDIYLTVNPMEKAALRETSGYNSQLVETGMPRYDALAPGEKSRTILFMPTWRRYLVPKLFGSRDESLIPFEGSTYEQFLRTFLASPRLHQMLERYDYRLKFLPHYNLQERLSSFPLTSPRTVLADTNKIPFQELIRECDAFVTDYSSVHFDVAYLGTPIIYALFDEDDFLNGHASVSWFEHERDGFGPVARDLDATLDALEDLLERECRADPYYTARIDRAFTYRDSNNSARVAQVISEAVTRM